MLRAVPLRLTGGFALVAMAALSSAECGGNDVVDPSDAADASDSDTFDGVSDAPLVDRSGETSSDDSSGPATGVDADAALNGAGDSSHDAAESELEGSAPALALGTAGTFALLAFSTITNTGVTTAIIGDVGISPGTALVNLPPGQVTGAIHLGDAVAAQAQSDVALAYNDLAGRPCAHTMSSVDLGGKTLTPGVYCFAVAAAQSVGDLTLDGQGDPNAVWIFQIGSTLTIANNVSTNMINAGNACNVYWQVGSSATINSGARLKGSVLAKASVTMVTGASVSPGRLLVQTAAVTLDSNAISNAGCR